jgi:hypothetical protein
MRDRGLGCDCGHAHEPNSPEESKRGEIFSSTPERHGRQISDALGADEKKPLWIEESNQRVYAYNYFGRHPERLVGWFNEHMECRSTNQSYVQRSA